MTRAAKTEKLKGRIVFENVSFAYQSAHKQTGKSVLGEVSFEAKPGEVPDESLLSD